MEQAKDTYIQYAEAGDQHVGRVVAGLPVLSAKYACSPPFFRMAPDMSKVEENKCTSADVDYAIATLFQNLSKR